MVYDLVAFIKPFIRVALSVTVISPEPNKGLMIVLPSAETTEGLLEVQIITEPLEPVEGKEIAVVIDERSAFVPIMRSSVNATLSKLTRATSGSSVRVMIME